MFATQYIQKSKKILDEAQQIYKGTAKYQIFRGNNRAGLISACLFTACKNCSAPRSTREIAKVMEVDTRVVSRGLKILQDLIHKHSIPLDTMKCGKVAAVHLIDRLCNDISEITTEHICGN